MEAAFWECFGDIVSEWNPCYSEEGHVRYTFDGEVGAHNVEVDCTKDLVRDEPIRVNLRAVLDKLFADEAAGRTLDLRPVRRLVASLVQKCGLTIVMESCRLRKVMPVREEARVGVFSAGTATLRNVFTAGLESGSYG